MAAALRSRCLSKLIAVAALAIALPGCHCLGVPSERFYEADWGPGCGGDCQGCAAAPVSAGPPPAMAAPKPFQKWSWWPTMEPPAEEPLQPPMSRFHPLPTQPVFAVRADYTPPEPLRTAEPEPFEPVPAAEPLPPPADVQPIAHFLEIR